MRGMVKMIQATSTQNWDGVILKISKIIGALGFEFWPHTHDKHHDPHSQVDLVHKTSGQRTELRVPAHLFLSLQLALAAKSWKTVDANNAVLARMFRGCFQGHEKKKKQQPTRGCKFIQCKCSPLRPKPRNPISSRNHLDGDLNVATVPSTELLLVDGRSRTLMLTPCLKRLPLRNGSDSISLRLFQLSCTILPVRYKMNINEPCKCVCVCLL